MKKNRLLNRTLSFGLALALFISSPASVYAEEMNDASVETIVENIDQGGASDEGESSGSDSTTASEGTNSESGSESAGSDQAGSGDSTPEANNSNSEEQVNKGETPESSDETTDDAEADADAEKNAEADADADKDAEDEDEEITYDYESNNDGTHVKKWTDKDGVAHEETEECEFGEDGKCIHCGYYDDSNEEVVLPTFNDGEVIITISGAKGVLNGATKVSASKITEENNAYSDVEDSLQSKAEDEGKELLTFLAYDIKLLDDNDNEVEPDADGKVSVKIERAIAPEEIDTNVASVEVKHFDESGSETEVVDMTEDEATTIETGDDKSSADVSFETSSFSIFTISWITEAARVGSITWNHDNSRTKTAYIYIVDENGSSLVNYINSATISYSLDYNQNLSDAGIEAVDNDYFYNIAKKFSIVGYRYEGAYSGDSGKQAQEIENIHYYSNFSNSEGWAYYLSSNAEDNFYYFGNLNNINEDTINIYLQFKSVVTTTKNFKVDLFTYEDDTWVEGNAAVNYAASQNASTKSDSDGQYLEMNYGGGSGDYNVYHSSGAYQGLADKTLVDDMISFSNYGTPGYFATDNYDKNKTDWYTDDSNFDITSNGSTTTYKYVTGYYNVSFPFIEDDGTYSFDSSFQNAKLSSNKKEVTVTNDSSSNGFWPFGSDHFGMHFSTEFYMTSDGTYNDQECVFKFSGDDDVWVYVDGKLVLDLGGIHGKVTGTINFATGEVNIDKVYHSSGNGASYNMYTSGVLGKSSTLNNGIHELQVYYLERGSTASNCSITFNMPTVDEEGTPLDFSFTKRNKETDLNLKGAKFALYDLEDNQIGDVVTSDEDGQVVFKNVEPGDYVLKEVSVLDGYADPNHTWNVKVYYLNGEGHFDITNTSDTNDLEYDSDIGYIIYNTPNTTDAVISADKTAEVVSWNDRTYKITLTGNAVVEDISKSKVDVVLVIDTSGSMLFPNDLEYEKECKVSDLDTKETYYYVTEDDAATVYTVQYKNDSWQYKDSSYVYLNNNYWTTISGKSSVLNTYTSYKFYHSPSYGKSIRFDDTKNAAKAFIDTLASHNSKNRVSIVTFNKDAETVQELKELKTSNVTSLKNEIDNLTTDGGTNQYKGLEKANNVLNERSSGDKKNRKAAIVLISDGTINQEYTADYKETQITNAKENAKVYSVGVDLDFSDNVKASAGKLLSEIATSGSYINAGQTGLKSFLQGIAYDILSVGGKNGTVIDEIDNRFTLVDSNENPISVGSIINGYIINENGAQEIISGTVREYSDGSMYIEWKSSCLRGFYAEFYLKAKDDFIGGNVIKTNCPGSSISSGTKDKAFPQPTVNVRLLDFSIRNNEITVLLNDNVDVKSYVKNLLATLTCYDGILADSESFSLNGLNFDNVDNLFDSNSSNDYVEYSYQGDGDIVGKFVLSLTKNEKANALTYTNGTSIATDLGDDVYVYTLTVSYQASEYDDRLATVGVNGSTVTAPIAKDLERGYKLVSDSSKCGTTYTSIKTTSDAGKFIVNVVDLGMIVTKIAASNKDKKLEGATYVLADLFSKRVSKTSGADGTMEWDGLGVGTYTLIEIEAPETYSISNETFTIEINRIESSEYSIKVSSNKNNQVIVYDTVDVSDLLMGSNDTVETTVKKIELSVTDTIAYTLPETGGSGVYVYTIGGILLMIAGALLLYKNKNNKSK